MKFDFDLDYMMLFKKIDDYGKNKTSRWSEQTNHCLAVSLFGKHGVGNKLIQEYEKAPWWERTFGYWGISKTYTLRAYYQAWEFDTNFRLFSLPLKYGSDALLSTCQKLSWFSSLHAPLKNWCRYLNTRYYSAQMQESKTVPATGPIQAVKNEDTINENEYENRVDALATRVVAYNAKADQYVAEAKQCRVRAAQYLVHVDQYREKNNLFHAIFNYYPDIIDGYIVNVMQCTAEVKEISKQVAELIEREKRVYTRLDVLTAAEKDRWRSLENLVRTLHFEEGVQLLNQSHANNNAPCDGSQLSTSSATTHGVGHWREAQRVQPAVLQAPATDNRPSSPTLP